MAINPINAPSPRGNNGGRTYSFASVPVIIDCTFVVASTDTGGLGITGLSGQGVNTVFMYTTQTAGIGPNGVANPLAHASSKGLISIQLANNYKRLLALTPMVASPVTGSNVAVNSTSLTIGQAYIITAVGTSTTADFVALGLSIGNPPVVGASFVAIATGSGSGNGTVKAVGSSGGVALELVGTSANNSATMWPIPTNGISPNIGASILLQSMSTVVPVTAGTAGNAVTLASGTTLNATGGGTIAASTVITQPPDGTVITLSLLLSQR